MHVILSLTFWMAVGIIVFVLYEKRKERCRRIQPATTSSAGSPEL